MCKEKLKELRDGNAVAPPNVSWIVLGFERLQVICLWFEISETPQNGRANTKLVYPILAHSHFNLASRQNPGLTT